MHLELHSQSGFHVVPVYGVESIQVTLDAFLQPQLVRGEPEPGGARAQQSQRLMPMLLPSVYRIGSSNVSTRN